MTKSLTYIEIDVDYCANVYGTAPCTASIPTTGTKKCFNTTATCQDRSNFVNAPVTLRFCMEGADFYPLDIDAVPSVVSVEHQPGKVSLGEDLGERAALNVTFRDHRDSDTGPACDKYLSSRSYDPFKQGSFFGKFRNRQKFIKGSPIRLIRGTLGQSLAGMKVRHFVVESFTGPDASGMYQIIAKDILKLADNDRAQAPVANNGFLSADITSTATSFTLSPSGIADLEYPTSGYLAIGGKEAVAFSRARGIDATTKLMLHMNGADAATTTTDNSASAHVVTFFGNAQLDTAQKKFGTASLLLDGTGDYIQLDGSSDFAFGTGDFTVELWFRLSAIGTQYVLYDSTPAGSSGVGPYPLLIVTSGNTLQFRAPSTWIAGATSLAANTWYHVALTRAAGVTRLFLNGLQEGGDYADTNNYLIGASRPVIGTNGGTVGANGVAGWIDEVSISKGVARWTRNFAPDVLEMSNTVSNTINITRAHLGTTAIAHKANDRVQVMLNYTGVDPAIIIYDLLKNYANVPVEFLPVSSWAAETNAHLAKVYTANIGEPTGVRTLIGELIEQAALAVWWDDVAQLVRLQVMRRIPTTAAVYDENNILEGTFSVRDQPEKRISQVWTFFNQINPLEKIDQPDNYKSAALTVDLQSESDYGSPAIKKIFSRWIPAGGLAVAQRVNAIQIARFKDPPRAFEFALFADEAAALGGGYQVGSWALQDDEGLPALAPVQVVRLTHAADSIRMAAEEVLFGSIADGVDPNARVIILDTSQNNVNIRTIHDSLYPVITTVGAITLTVMVADGVIIGSSNTSTPAMDIGTFPAGLPITLRVAGRIQGAGGNGGSFGSPGLSGGTALITTHAVSLDAAGGEIWGGGGGGGTTGSGAGQPIKHGGGGAGTVPGLKGGSSASDGTSEAGGAGGQGGSSGGGPGLSGGGTNGGVAGNAINGISFVTVINAGDRRGAVIN